MEAVVCCDATTFAPGATDSSMTSYTVGDSTYSYDAAGRLFQLDHDLNGAGDTTYTWTYDELSRVKTFTNTGHTSENATYTYDDIAQLTDATFDGGPDDEGYEYDAAGNRAEVNGMITYQTDPYNRLTFDGTYTYLYDEEGNQIARFVDNDESGSITTGDASITQYDWDHRNRLIRVTDKSSPVLTTQVVEYSYDVFDRRIASSVYEDGDLYVTRREFYVYDRGNVLLDFVDSDGEETAEVPTLARRYLHGPLVDQVLAQEDYDASTGESEDIYWLMADNQGTTRDVIEYNAGTSATVVEAHLAYSAFGVPDGDTSLTRYLFTGREWDTDVNLQYNRNRWYNPAIGRWQSEDPVPADVNAYRYAFNSATNGTDPYGLDGSFPPDRSYTPLFWATAYANLGGGPIGGGCGNSAQSNGINYNAPSLGAVGSNQVNYGGGLGLLPPLGPIDPGPIPLKPIQLSDFPPDQSDRPLQIESVRPVGWQMWHDHDAAISQLGFFQGLLVTQFENSLGVSFFQTFTPDSEPSLEVTYKDPPLGHPQTILFLSAGPSQEALFGEGLMLIMPFQFLPEPVVSVAPSSAALESGAPQLPAWNGQTTYGVLVTDEGNVISLQSGKPNPIYDNYPAASHAEGKAAIMIRESSSAGGTMYHNNPSGTCAFCNSQIPTLLPEGATLRVVPPAGTVTPPRWFNNKFPYVGNSALPKRNIRCK
jgi:RHS repeat-associated protein